MKTKRIFNRILVTVAAFLIMLFVGFESTLSIPAKAEETYSITAETDVEDDLSHLVVGEAQKAFNLSDYPEKADDYSLTVLTISEGADKGLFIYVYQPSTNTKFLQAINLSMSTLPTGNEKAEWRLYTLDMLDEYGAIQKYKVDNFEVSTDSVRFYDITRISRIFDSDIDTPEMLDESQTINLVAVEVATCWEVKTVDGKVTYHPTKIETIPVTVKYVGYIRYDGGFSLYSYDCDAYFVAFSTDRKIDELIEADIRYVTKSYECATGLGLDGEPDIGEPVPVEKTVSVYDEPAQNELFGLWGKQYTWNRVQSAENFISKAHDEEKDINFVEGVEESLENTEWVLNFAEYDYAFESAPGVNVTRKTLVENVTLLRLSFVTDGIPYNLGVVDNEQTGSQNPSGSGDTLVDDAVEDLKKWIEELKAWFNELGQALKTVMAVLVLCLFGGVVLGVISLLFPVLKVVFKALWAVICLPFKLIGKLFKRGKKR